jgi:hypothetical protein
MRSAEDVFEFFAADVVMREFPNRIAPEGEVGAKTIYGLPTNEDVRSREHRGTRCRNIIESGDEVGSRVGMDGIPLRCWLSVWRQGAK